MKVKERRIRDIQLTSDEFNMLMEVDTLLCDLADRMTEWDILEHEGIAEYNKEDIERAADILDTLRELTVFPLEG